jgi:predicted alpha-1,2-mannosidase
MNRFGYFVLSILLILSGFGNAAESQRRPVDWVNPLIDTHDSRWFYFSSASRPFGMVNLSPDTKRHSSWHSGYVYDSTAVRCFSHVHAWQLAGIPVMPTTGELQGHLGMDVYKSAFSHETEIVKPGYHKVVLQDYGITAELTSTTRVGFHKYTFSKNEKCHILFDTGAYLAHGPTKSSFIKKKSDTEIVGYSVTTALRTGLDGTEKRRLLRPKEATIYFAAELSTPFEKFGVWKDKQLLDGDAKSLTGKNIGGYITFSTKANNVVYLKVAISYTSIEQAQLNLKEELPHWDFDRVKKESIEEWNDWLSRIEVEGGSDQQKTKLYTDVWHALLGRRTMSDVDGKYCDMTGDGPVIRQVKLGTDGKPLYPHLNFDALWGTHWSCNILWSMAYPNVMDWFCNTMLDMYRDGGLIPRGPSAGNYSFVMIGDPAASFFACAYNKGIRNYDVELAYKGLRKNAFPGGIRAHAGYEHSKNATGGDIAHYIKHGYVPEDIDVGVGHQDGAAMTLEYSYQDWCMAQFAKALGKTSDYELFMKRSHNYKTLWDTSLKLMRPRARNGKWMEGVYLIRGEDFCESNAIEYTFFVPHDIAGMCNLFGSREKYTDVLNFIFESSRSKNFHRAMLSYHNQPATGMAHMFNYADAPWLSQKWVREVKERTFGDTTPYGGYNGDEDQGQMGALSALMALGLFEVRGGAGLEPIYEITSPVFDKVTIHLDSDYYSGKTFVISTKNNSKDNMYIQSAKLNGKPWNKCWLTHKVFAQGGKLFLDLGPDPNKNWANAVKDAPPSMSQLVNQ